MKQARVHRLILDIVREVAHGRPVTSETDFSQIGIGPWRGGRHTVELDGHRWAFHVVDAGDTHVATVATDDVRAVVDARWWSDTMIVHLAQWAR